MASVNQEKDVKLSPKQGTFQSEEEEKNIGKMKHKIKHII